MEIEQDIGVQHNFFSPDQCNRIIEHWERLQTLELSHTRQQLGDGGKLEKADSTVFLMETSSLRLSADQPFMAEFLDQFWRAYDAYTSAYGVMNEGDRHWIRGMRLQKTLPGEGYHRWHYEADGAHSASRICAFSLYLNTVDTGGETEFLRQHLRQPCTQGTLLIWPANYTHVHRGNPPLSGVKYLLTGWTEW